MPLITKATEYILSILTEDETVKHFPKEFVAESAKWVRSRFLKDDPRTEPKLQDPDRSPESKKAVIEIKLEDMLENPQFKAALEQQLAAFEQQKTRLKNVVDKSDIDVKGNVHIGDKGSASGDNYDEKNIIKGSTIKAGGDFRLGDDIVQASGNVHFGDIHYHGGTAAAGRNTAAPEPSAIVKALRSLIAAGRTGEVFPKLLDHAETHAPRLLDEVSQLSARWETLKRKERNGILSNSEANVERNQVINALLELIGAFDHNS